LFAQPSLRLLATLLVASLALAGTACEQDEAADPSTDPGADIGEQGDSPGSPTPDPGTAEDTGSTGPSSPDASSSDASSSDSLPPWDPTRPLGGERPARVLLPDAYDPAEPWPLVVLLHGHGATSVLQDTYLRLSAQRNAYGFITVLPEGRVSSTNQQFWNATEACCDFFDTGTDDVAYLTGLLDEAQARLAIDPNRIYFIGHSNGSFMSFRMACELGNRIAALASIAGSTFANEQNCRAPGDTAILHVHGTLDAVIFYDGGALYGKPYPGAREVVDRWAERKGCSTPERAGELDLDTQVAGSETERLRWTDCSADKPVELWTMTGSSHIPSFRPSFIENVLDFLFANGG
jgi:polyhydroxybutyrate depolymerase